jgi:hypothetical protein
MIPKPLILTADDCDFLIETELELPGPIPLSLRLWTIFMAFWNPRQAVRLTKSELKRKFRGLFATHYCEQIFTPESSE